ncbi:MAG: hypothetical protein PGN23_11845 [Sphingomonas adhaesiva]|uniref:hypothetical protein n=1 Tax=Sphingomonas adhaesiva TaxID=28212 RepID=UPI002FF9AF4E
MTTAPAWADTLPLARGAYVQNGIACREAPNVALRDYNGQGIGSSKAGQCQARVLAHIGRRYTLRQRCVEYGGRAPVMGRAERLKLRVDARDAFTDLSDGTRYRLCPALRL